MNRQQGFADLILIVATVGVLTVGGAILDAAAERKSCAELWQTYSALDPSSLRGRLALRAVDRNSCYSEDYYDGL